jgi:signal transduction histidine kinase
VYASARGWVGDGIVGGATAGPGLETEARVTGELIVRVLGRRAGDRMPAVENVRGSLVADWRQLRRWGMSEQRLPPRTEILFRPPTTWERYQAVILGAAGLFMAQSLLIALLLLERQRRIRAQRALEDRAAYDQTIAELTTDTVRHVSNEASHALDDALARIARYAGARAAALIEYPESPLHPPSRIVWTDPATANGHDSSSSESPELSNGDSRLAIPLVADGGDIGALELYGASPRRGWPTQLVGRLDAAGELIAGAMAHSRAARAVRRGEDLNRAVLASLSTHIAILDRNGTIIRVNRAWRELARSGGVAADRDAFLGDNYLDECRRAEDRGNEEAREVRLGIEAVLTGQTWPFRHEYRCSPEERWYELSVDRLEHSEGGAIVTHLDITDRRRAEHRAEETRRQIAHMGRVAMVGELAGAVSHELRQPLAAIRANAEAGSLLLGQDPPEVREAREIFMDIVVDDIRASEIIDNIRTLLRKQEPTSSSVSLNEICRQAVHLLQRDAALRKTRLELALARRLPAVIGDPIQLQQVVLNLILNAIDAVASSAGDREVTVGTALRSTEVEISVRDNGYGLPPHVLKHLFESFFSTKSEGLGMGLTIARSIVERHHGKMRAENHPAGGAVFRVLIPVAEVAGGTA